MFLGTAHTAEVIEATVDAAKQAIVSLQEVQPAR
jgi:hypothetical protein